MGSRSRHAAPQRLRRSASFPIPRRSRPRRRPSRTVRASAYARSPVARMIRLVRDFRLHSDRPARGGRAVRAQDHRARVRRRLYARATATRGAGLTGSVPAATVPPKPRCREDAAPAQARQSWAQEMFGYPDVTGSVGEAKAAGQADARRQGREPSPKSRRKATAPAATPVPIDGHARFAGRARRARTPAGAPQGARSARARARHAREPAQGRGEAPRAAPRTNSRSWKRASTARCRRRTRPRRPGSRASSPCTRT